MKKEIIQVDKKTNTFRVTTTDERWYAIESKNKVTGLPEYKYIPSVTWIAGFYPKGIAYYKWLAGKGWDEAESIKVAAGEKGSKVHQAIELLIAGEEIKMADHIMNPQTNGVEELTVEEYDCLVAFDSWCKKYKPVFLTNEKTVISKKYDFAGTVDCIALIEDKPYIIDFKTSQYIWPEHEMQVSAYCQALCEADKKDYTLAILQLGYKRNKDAFKFTEVENKFDLFLHAKAIWENETSGQNPTQKDYPISIKLDLEKGPKK